MGYNNTPCELLTYPKKNKIKQVEKAVVTVRYSVIFQHITYFVLPYLNKINTEKEMGQR